MSILTFSREIQQDLALLLQLPSKFFTEFCKLAIANIKTGSANERAYQGAAKQLSVEKATVVAAIQALSQVYLECSKRLLSHSAFVLSVSELEFTDEQQEIASEFYQTNVADLRAFQSQTSIPLPHYHNLDWRFDIQIASRCLRQQATPMFILELETHWPDRKRVETFQSDYANLKNIESELEIALSQMKNSHSRKITRFVQ